MNINPEICNAFNSHAFEYEKAAKVQYEIGTRLDERLDYIKITPRTILDLGCGPGVFSKRLKMRYPKAKIVGLDIAYNMLALAKNKSRWWQRKGLVNGDMMQLPFKSGAFDLVFANQVIHWSTPLDVVIRELNRVLSPGGCLMFSTLGPDTFQELRAAFKVADSYAHVNDFMDMHDVGDCLLREQFQDPVVDMELLTAHFSTLPELLNGLKAQGVRNINSARNPGLTGKHLWSKFKQKITDSVTVDGKFPLTYEVVYGHAWKGMKQNTAQGIETYISVEQLKLSLRER